MSTDSPGFRTLANFSADMVTRVIDAKTLLTSAASGSVDEKLNVPGTRKKAS
jgi:hypothetical protein